MIIQIKKVGSNAFGNWCVFNAIIDKNFVINGIAKYDELLELKDNETYNDLFLYAKQRNGKTYYKLMKNS